MRHSGSAPPFKWAVLAAKFEQAMVMTAIVKLDGVVQSEGTLAAFVGSQVRGVSGPSPKAVPFGPHAGVHTFDLMIYSNKGDETVSFQFADGRGVINQLNETRRMVADDVVGNVMNPFVLGARAAAPKSLDRLLMRQRAP